MTALFVFDAYGTLFDVHSAVARHAARMGEAGAAVSQLWRVKQLEYSWVRTLTGRYRDFWYLTETALDFALAAVPGADPALRNDLLDAYRTLDCYPEVPSVLERLRARGGRTAILSNGSPDMLDSAVQAAGLGGLLDAVLSVDGLGQFKTMPETYALVTDRFGCAPGDVAFHSSNRWDVAGATAFGFRCRWINRTGAPEEYADLAPEHVCRSLEELPDLAG